MDSCVRNPAAETWTAVCEVPFPAVVHTRGAADADATREIIDLLNARGVFHEVWEGEVGRRSLNPG